MSGKSKAELEAENAMLRAENEALLAFIAVVEAAAESAPQAVYDDREKHHLWQTDVLIRINVIAGLLARRVSSPGSCAETLAGYAARPVPYRAYAPEAAESSSAEQEAAR